MKTKVFFFGTPEIAVPSLKKLSTLEAVDIVGVGVFPDRPVGRKKVLTPCPVKVAALDLGLTVVEIASKEDLIKAVQDSEIDLGIVIAFGMIFPEEVLEKPKLGIVNVHFSLLPEYRGASPVQSAILDGKTQTGITWQKMVKALDAGDVLWQTEHEITNQTTAEVWQDFSEFTAEEFPVFIDHYINGQLIPQKQKEESATFCGKFTKEDGAINPKKESAQSIYQKFLAFQPWPGIYLETPHGRLKILKCHLNTETDTPILNCLGQSFLSLEKVQLEGKKPSTMKGLLNGYPNILET